MELVIKSGEVLTDIGSAGWLEQELHPELDRHRRHQMADICEPDNAERVWRSSRCFARSRHISLTMN